MPDKTLKCVIVTPEKAVLDEPSDSIVLPFYDGELGILPGRAPLIGRLGFGELRTRQGSTTKRFFIDTGFAQVRDDVVTVLTARATRVEDINVAAAQQALEEASKPAAAVPGAEAARQKAQGRARAQIRVAEAKGS